MALLNRVSWLPSLWCSCSLWLHPQWHLDHSWSQPLVHAPSPSTSLVYRWWRRNRLLLGLTDATSTLLESWSCSSLTGETYYTGPGCCSAIRTVGLSQVLVYYDWCSFLFHSSCSSLFHSSRRWRAPRLLWWRQWLWPQEWLWRCSCLLTTAFVPQVQA